MFEEERTLERLGPKTARSGSSSDLVAPLPHVADVRRRGLMSASSWPTAGRPTTRRRMGHRVTLAARDLGAIVRPLATSSC